MQTMESPRHQDPIEAKGPKNDLKEVFSKDVTDYLETKAGLNITSLLRLMGNIVDDSTLRRNVAKQTTPSERTIIAFYKVKFGVSSDSELIEIVSPTIREYIKQYFDTYKTPLKQSDLSDILDNLLASDPFTAEIYSLTCFDAPLSLMDIEREYGNKGLKLVNKLCDLGAVQIDNKAGLLKRGGNRSSYSREIVNKLANSFLLSIENNAPTKENQETGYIQFEDLNEQGLQMWIEEDKRHRKVKMEIAKDPSNHGRLRACTIGFTNTFSMEKNKEGNRVH